MFASRGDVPYAIVFPLAPNLLTTIFLLTFSSSVPAYLSTATMADSLFNRPPSISEDALQYTIYPRLESSDRISATTIAVAIQSFVDSVLADFIWHRDPFQIKVVKNLEGDDAWMLEGLMRVGDSIDDEWCTVWLLREISAKWDLAIRCALRPYPFLRT